MKGNSYKPDWRSVVFMMLLTLVVGALVYFSSRPTARVTSPLNGAAIPVYKKDIGLTGYYDNRPFGDFLRSNDGNVIYLRMTVDASLATRPAFYFKENCPPLVNAAGDKAREPLFGTTWSLPMLSPERLDDIAQGASPKLEESGYLCSTRIQFRGIGGSDPEWSSGGTGTVTWEMNHFFRVSRSVSGSETTYVLSEIQAAPSDFATVQDRVP